MINQVMMSISTWDRMHFWIDHLNYNSLAHQTWPIDRYKQGQWFSGIFWRIWRTGTKFQVHFYLATYSNYSITNYVKISVFHFYGTFKTSTIKNDQISLHCHFKKIIKGSRTNFQSPALKRTMRKRSMRKCNFHYVAIPMTT